MRINLAAGDRYFPDFEGSDLAPEHPLLRVVDLAQPLPYSDGSVSVAMISHALALLPDETQQLAIREVFRVLQPDGWFRIDDAPQRFYLAEADRDRDFDRSRPRADLVRWLLDAGFLHVLSVFPGTTRIPERPEVIGQILANKSWHESFSIEAQK